MCFILRKPTFLGHLKFCNGNHISKSSTFKWLLKDEAAPLVALTFLVVSSCNGNHFSKLPNIQMDFNTWMYAHVLYFEKTIFYISSR